MKRKIGMLDVVALLVDLPEAGLINGEMGTVVEILAPNVYEVEFADKQGQTYAELAVDGANLMLLHNQGAASEIPTSD